MGGKFPEKGPRRRKRCNVLMKERQEIWQETTNMKECSTLRMELSK
jgi:hypothetical protein